MPCHYRHNPMGLHFFRQRGMNFVLGVRLGEVTCLGDNQSAREVDLNVARKLSDRLVHQGPMERHTGVIDQSKQRAAAQQFANLRIMSQLQHRFSCKTPICSCLLPSAACAHSCPIRDSKSRFIPLLPEALALLFRCSRLGTKCIYRIYRNTGLSWQAMM